MRKFKIYIKVIAFYIVFILFLCEYAFYYVVQVNCKWPTLNHKTADKTIEDSNETPVKVMVFADTHLLGSKNGHWWDKLRREWQMHRAFQTAMTLHKPEVVFVLGDLTDEGLWCGEAEFQYYVKRFQSLFAVPEGTQMHVAVGNHDIGFHYGISPFLNGRFESAFDAPAVKMVSMRGNHFVLVNSMALEGDGCFLCKPAELQLGKIEAKLKCTKGIRTCEVGMKLDKYSRPILLQHYPLYRESDAMCTGTDAGPETVRNQLFRERWECLSREATYQLMDMLKPRLVLSGHTHHGCKRTLPNGAVEITIPSFSWRNKNNPNYALAVFTPNNYAIDKCEMPCESTVFMIYCLGGVFLMAHLVHVNLSRRYGHMFKIK